MSKYLIIGFLLMECSLVYSADWTSEFSHLEFKEIADEGQTLNMIMENTVIADSVKNNTFKKDVLTINAKTGNFNVREPFKKDIQPAKMVKNNGKELEVKIPLKNASLYGYKLESFTYYLGCVNCGDFRFHANFAPMSEAQFINLKRKAKFAYIDDEVCISDYSAKVLKDKGKVIIALNVGC